MPITSVCKTEYSRYAMWTGVSSSSIFALSFIVLNMRGIRSRGYELEVTFGWPYSFMVYEFDGPDFVLWIYDVGIIASLDIAMALVNVVIFTILISFVYYSAYSWGSARWPLTFSMRGLISAITFCSVILCITSRRPVMDGDSIARLAYCICAFLAGIALAHCLLDIVPKIKARTTT